jgi:hypothetical protein
LEHPSNDYVQELNGGLEQILVENMNVVEVVATRGIVPEIMQSNARAHIFVNGSEYYEDREGLRDEVATKEPVVQSHSLAMTRELETLSTFQTVRVSIL